VACWEQGKDALKARNLVMRAPPVIGLVG
jgi:hypothetical protein